MTVYWKFAKAPSEKLDYSISYSAELVKTADRIVASLWVVPSNTVDGPGNSAIALDDGVTVDYDENNPSPAFTQGGTSFNDDSTTIVIESGTLAAEYDLENRVVTEQGRRYARRIKVVIVNRYC